MYDSANKSSALGTSFSVNGVDTSKTLSNSGLVAITNAMVYNYLSKYKRMAHYYVRIAGIFVKTSISPYSFVVCNIPGLVHY